MPLKRGQIVGYNGDRMSLKFTMVHEARTVDCEVIPNPGSRDSGQGYPNQHLFDSTWRTKEVRHAYPASG